MKKIFPTNKTIREIFRYGTVTVGSYIFLFSGTAILVELFSLNESYAYASVLVLTYIGVYISSVYFTFRTQVTTKSMRRYVVLLIVSFFVNTGVFTLLHNFFGLHYLIVMILNVAFLGPLRYLASKYLVYESSVQISS